MAMSKEFQRVEQAAAETANILGRLEAKLDALLGKNLSKEEIEGIKYPPAREMKPISSGAPYTIKDQNLPESTTEVPASEASASPAPSVRVPVLEHKNTITPPVVAAAPSAEPSEGYDALTEGEAIKLVKVITDPVEQERYLAYERANKNRERVLEAIAVDPSAAPTAPATTTTTTTKPSPTASTGKVS